MTIEEQRKDFNKWLDTTSWKNDSETFHNDLFEAWKACNARYEQVRISDLKDTKYHLVNALGIAVNPLYVIKDKS
jgi:hypothetical protein